MAIAIKSIPVLKDEAARRFQENADASPKKDKIDFSKQVKAAKSILAKAKMR